MEKEDWLARWREGRTGWHQSEVTPLLQQHWGSLDLPPGTRVLVPLCGQSLDLLWLAQQGHEVLGVELSEWAVQQFFARHGLDAERREVDGLARYRAGRLTVIAADIFDVAPRTLATCTAVFDRAALIALPPVRRRRYAHEVYGQLRRGSRGLLLTLEYPQEQMAGPPFSVAGAEVQALFGPEWDIRHEQRWASSGPERASPDARFNAAAYRLERR